MRAWMWWGRWLVNGGYRIAVGVEVGLAARLGKRRKLRNRGHKALRLHGHAEVAVRHSLQENLELRTAHTVSESAGLCWELEEPKGPQGNKLKGSSEQAENLCWELEEPKGPKRKLGTS